MTTSLLRLLSSAAVLAGMSLPAVALDKVTYQLDWLPGGDKAPIYVCIEQGFCADAGLEVAIEPGRGSSEAVTKIATGTSDIGSAGIGALMAAVATEDVPVTAVMSIFNMGRMRSTRRPSPASRPWPMSKANRLRHRRSHHQTCICRWSWPTMG